MNRLFSSAAVYTAANVASAAVPFLLLPALTRVMSPNEYGQVAIFTTLVTLFGAVVGLSTHGSISVRYFDKSIKNFGVYISSCITVMLCSLTFATLLLLVAFAFFPDAVGISLNWSLAALAVAATSFIMQVRLVVWLAQKRAVKYAILQVSYAVLNAGLSLVLVLQMQGGAPGRMGAHTIAVALAAMIAIFSLIHSRLLPGKFSLPYMKAATRFGLPLVLHLLGSTILVTFDRFVIRENLGLSETGIYMVAVQISLSIALVADAINKAFAPWLYERLAENRSDFPLWIVKRSWLCFSVIAIVGTCISLFAEPLILLVAGSKYLDAAIVLPWLIIGQSFGTAYFLVANYIFYSQRTYFLGIASLSSGVFSAFMTLLLVPKVGIVGAGISFCFCQALLFLQVWWYANRVHPMPWFFWRHRKKRSQYD